MPSVEYQRFVAALMNDQLALEEKASIQELRQAMEDMVAAMHPAPSFAKYEVLDMDGVPGESVTVGEQETGKVLLYLHGGAFKMGSARQDRHLTAELARRTGARVVAVDYRLSPENKFPAALEDCLGAYRWLLADGYQPADTAFVGVSAGGTLVLATTLALKDQGVSLPRAVVAISPGTYLDSAAGTHTSNRATDVILGRDEDLAAAVLAMYAPGEDPRNPYISPLYGDYSGFPSLLLVVGTAEIFYDDAVLLADKARAAAADVELIIGQDMLHAYPVFVEAFPESEAALGDICRFLSKRLGVRA